MPEVPPEAPVEPQPAHPAPDAWLTAKEAGDRGGVLWSCEAERFIEQRRTVAEGNQVCSKH